MSKCDNKIPCTIKIRNHKVESQPLYNLTCIIVLDDDAIENDSTGGTLVFILSKENQTTNLVDRYSPSSRQNVQYALVSRHVLSVRLVPSFLKSNHFFSKVRL